MPIFSKKNLHRRRFGWSLIWVCMDFACDFYPQSNKYASFEQAPEIAPGQPIVLQKKTTDLSAQEALEIPPEECNGTRALTPEGQCQVLNVRQFGNSERVQIPTGELIRGQVPSVYDSSAQQEHHVIRWPDQPLRKVLVNGFWIDVVEVSRKQYQSCVEENKCTPAQCPDKSTGIPSNFSDEFDQERLPQTCITHRQAMQFCLLHDSRLPTAVEWEYAARGQEYRPFPWGDQLRDEVTLKIIPVGSKIDASYFGVLGLATSGFEWVADVFQRDHAFADHLTGTYRDKSSPSSQVLQQFENLYFCAGQPDCRPTKQQKTRHVYKGVLVGHTMAAYDIPPQQPDIRSSPEGWNPIVVANNLGFRCASDLSTDDIPMHLSPTQKDLLMTTQEEDIESYVGVFEAVTFSEAKRACQVLKTENLGKSKNKWRLPTVDEFNKLHIKIPGPGPYWLQDGQAASYSQQKPVEPSDTGKTNPWTTISAQPTDTLLARCVRTL